MGADLSTQRVLEIGTRYGRMASLFALLGADVTAVEMDADSIPLAEREAEMWGVACRTRFLLSEGDLSMVADESFDLAFTKSVLGMITDLEGFLWQIRSKLRPGGKVVFVENMRGNPLVHALRRLRRKGQWWRGWHFFTKATFEVVRRVFDVAEIRTSALPPVCLILGSKPDRPLEQRVAVPQAVAQQ
jgi:SAM-dependent methyltransferase